MEVLAHQRMESALLLKTKPLVRVQCWDVSGMEHLARIAPVPHAFPAKIRQTLKPANLFLGLFANGLQMKKVPHALNFLLQLVKSCCIFLIAQLSQTHIAHGMEVFVPI